MSFEETTAMNEKTDFAVETDKNKKESNLLQIKADDPNKETLLALLESEITSKSRDTIGYTNVEDALRNLKNNL